ncbi:MAG: hypothetical protein Q8N63_00645 [Nanoarchaeota archaeon]|nr:hypothetical protein [Nanoarchaeota archaeon]
MKQIRENIEKIIESNSMNVFAQIHLLCQMNALSYLDISHMEDYNEDAEILSCNTVRNYFLKKNGIVTINSYFYQPCHVRPYGDFGTRLKMFLGKDYSITMRIFFQNMSNEEVGSLVSQIEKIAEGGRE